MASRPALWPCFWISLENLCASLSKNRVKTRRNWNWRDGSMVWSTCYFVKGLEFKTQHLYWVLYYCLSLLLQRICCLLLGSAASTHRWISSQSAIHIAYRGVLFSPHTEWNSSACCNLVRLDHCAKCDKLHYTNIECFYLWDFWNSPIHR